MELAKITPGGKAELFRILQNSLYPGASNDSLDLVIGYCQASGLDVMRKPVHIVPMWNSAANKMVDVIMPGIGLYRTLAMRAGHCGTSEPEFGPMVAYELDGVKMTVPEWCRVSVFRLIEGVERKFTGFEYWIENYSKKGKSAAPNSMWQQRPRAQLAKCAEAQALRKAFPEESGPPTAEEMEGKPFEKTEKPVAARVVDSAADQKAADEAQKSMLRRSLREFATQDGVHIGELVRIGKLNGLPTEIDGGREVLTLAALQAMVDGWSDLKLAEDVKPEDEDLM